MTYPCRDLGVVPVLPLGVGDPAELDDLGQEGGEVEEGPEGGEPELLKMKQTKFQLRTISV